MSYDTFIQHLHNDLGQAGISYSKPGNYLRQISLTIFQDICEIFCLCWGILVGIKRVDVKLF